MQKSRPVRVHFPAFRVWIGVRGLPLAFAQVSTWEQVSRNRRLISRALVQGLIVHVHSLFFAGKRVCEILSVVALTWVEGGVLCPSPCLWRSHNGEHGEHPPAKPRNTRDDFGAVAGIAGSVAGCRSCPGPARGARAPGSARAGLISLASARQRCRRSVPLSERRYNARLRWVNTQSRYTEPDRTEQKLSGLPLKRVWAHSLAQAYLSLIGLPRGASLYRWFVPEGSSAGHIRGGLLPWREARVRLVLPRSRRQSRSAAPSVWPMAFFPRALMDGMIVILLRVQTILT